MPCAAHMLRMAESQLSHPGDPRYSSQRLEAQDPATTPERLHELIHLPGDRGDIDSDAGWCREYVAANTSTGPDTLDELAADDDDFISRLHAARNPNTRPETVQKLIFDRNEHVARAAFERYEAAGQK